MFSIKSESAKKTIELGQKFSSQLLSEDVIILEGSLGGGKTTFTRGVLRGLKSTQEALSPTFTLLRQYQTRRFLVNHLDLYRLDLKDALDLGLDDILYLSKSITLIEWGNRIKQELDKYIKIEFSYLGQNIRKLSFSLKGYDKNRLLKAKSRLLK